MSDKTAHGIVKLLILVLVIQLCVIGYVFYTGYQGRVGIVGNQQRGCERAKKDRIANAEGWRIAETARRQSGDIPISHRYGALAGSLEARSKINCQKAFPEARLIP